MKKFWLGVWALLLAVWAIFLGLRAAQTARKREKVFRELDESKADRIEEIRALADRVRRAQDKAMATRRKAEQAVTKIKETGHENLATSIDRLNRHRMRRASPD